MIPISVTSASLPTKKRILAVCVKLFLEKGYKQTTLSEINEKAGVSYSQFQNIFRAKDGVLTELVEFMFENQFAMARSAAGAELPPVYVYAVETAIQMTLTELNENLREIYIEAYSQREAYEYILRETAKELYAIFGCYQPQLGLEDFYELEIGSGSFVPGFEDQIIGMKAGEEKDIDITFPENYTKDLAGKQVVFHVKVNEVKEKQTPALDDEFAKDVSEFETLKELKDDTKAKITAEREQSAKIAFENALLEKVAGDIKADIPEVMIEEQCRRFLDEFKQRLQAQGIPYDQYCKMTGMDEAKFMEDGREPAVRQVKMDLAIAAIIKAENLDVTDEEIEEKYKSMAEQYGMELDMLKKYLDAPTVRNQLLNEKAIAVVVDSAKAEKPAKAEKTEGEEEKKPAKKTAKKAAEGEEEKKPAAKKTTKKAAEGEEEKKPAKKTAKKAAEKAE